MTWVKGGLIYAPDGTSPWARHSALQPTPLILPGRIRVFVGQRDDHGVSRVGFVDVDPNDVTRVLGVATEPALDIGEPGTFDDNGVVPCAVVSRGNAIWLYYAGYSLPRKVRFHVFGGLAVSNDGGCTFNRVRRTPLLDRTDQELYFRVLHSILYENGRWRAWYGGGSSFEPPTSDGHTRAVYNIRYMESPDGIHFPDEGEVAIDVAAGEHRVGRPYVLPRRDGYEMFFASATRALNYRLSYATSADGRHWQIDQAGLGLTVSATGWDSEMMSYPSVVDLADRRVLFYNGNGYGRTGFGYAVSEA